MALQGNALAPKAEATGNSYVLRPLVQGIHLSEGGNPGVKITCVELWGQCKQLQLRLNRLLRDLMVHSIR